MRAEATGRSPTWRITWGPSASSCATAEPRPLAFTMVRCSLCLALFTIATGCAHRLAEFRTPLPGPEPRINGSAVIGCRPGHPFLYRVPCQGQRPMRFSADSLPPTLKLDADTGIL